MSNFLEQCRDWQLDQIVKGRDIGFYEALRVSGIISDPTPREAVKNMERAA